MLFPLSLVALTALAQQSHAVLLPDFNHFKSSYDFIVVGGGTAGLVLANRLSENAAYNVLVIEAGVSDANIQDVQVPYLSPYLAKGTPYDWNFTTTAMPGLGGRAIDYPFGHLLGGSSSVAHFTYTRSSSDDWNRYATLTGDSGWSWSRMQKYFAKNEKLTPPADGRDTTGEINPALHSTTGVMGVSLGGYLTPLDPRIVSASQELAEFPYNEDMNSGNPLGVGWLPSTIENGARVSSSTSYLAPAYLKRKNLDVILNTRVTRVLSTSSSRSPKLTKVEFAASSSGTRHTLTAKKEVIISAGAVASPHILVHSGVGPAATLKSLGITAVKANPSVGQNLTDQPLLALGWEVNNPDSYDNFIRNATLAAETLADWVDNRQGPYTTSAGVNHLAWNRIPSNSTIWEQFTDPSSGSKSPHYEFLFFNQILADLFSTPDSNANYMSIVVSALTPLSRGQLTWNSSDPFSMPSINPNLLDSEYDKFVMREGIRAARRFIAAPAWSDYAIAAVSTNATSDADLDAFVAANSLSLYQAGSTNAMTSTSSSWGVVDPNFKVKGIRGLRVVDASVLPKLPAAHLQVVVYAFAERAADIIKEDWA